MGSFKHHEACDECGSSDAKAVYEDGSAYCFSCEHNFTNSKGEPAEWTEEERPAKFADTNFLEGTIQPLKKRGLSVATCKKFNYRISKIKGTPVQVADYNDKAGRLVAQHIRFPDKNFIWLGDARKVTLFGQQIWKSFGKRIIITEGEIDAMTISQALGNKWPVVSVPSGAQSAKKYIKRNLEYVCSFDEIVFAFDQDEQGREATKECAALVPPGVAKVMKFDGYKDANELYQNDPNRVAKCVYEAEVWRPDGIIAGTSLWDIVMKEPEPGLMTPYPRLNDRTLGIKKGELWIWTAGSGIGKSTAVHEIGYNLAMEHGETLGVMALEESIKIAAERHIGIHLGVPMQTRREEVDEETLRAAYEATVGNGRYYFYNHFGSTQIDNLLQKVRYMVVGLGCSFILLDHISIVVSGLDFGIGDSERLMIDRLLTKLRSLVEETGCGIQAIVHLKRKAQNRGKGYNEGGIITLSDLRGSGSLEQLSDAVVGMERDQQREDIKNLSRLRVLKCRRTGDTGVADILEYSQFNGRLLATDLIDFPQREEINHEQTTSSDDF